MLGEIKEEFGFALQRKRERREGRGRKMSEEKGRNEKGGEREKAGRS